MKLELIISCVFIDLFWLPPGPIFYFVLSTSLQTMRHNRKHDLDSSRSPKKNFWSNHPQKSRKKDELRTSCPERQIANNMYRRTICNKICYLHSFFYPTFFLLQLNLTYMKPIFDLGLSQKYHFQVLIIGSKLTFAACCDCRLLYSAMFIV